MDRAVERWNVDAGDWVTGSPTVVDGTVYVGTEGGRVLALDADTGERQWGFTAEKAISGSVSVAGTTAVVSSEDGHMYAIDTGDGTERWRYELGSLVYHAPSPAILDGTVYVGTSQSGTNHVSAVDLDSGATRWQRGTEGSVSLSPTAVRVGSDRTVFVVVDPTMDDNALVALDGGDGSERWRYTSAKPLETAPTVARRAVQSGEHEERLTVFLPDRHWSTTTRVDDDLADDTEPPSVEAERTDEPGGTIYGFDARTGQRRVRIAAPGPPVTTPTVADGTLFAGTADGVLFAADIGSGERRWTHRSTVTGGVELTAAPTVAGQQVLTGAQVGGLIGVQTADGSGAWQALPAGGIAGVTVADGTAYVSVRDGVAAVTVPACSTSSRGSRVRRATQGHHDETTHRRERPADDGRCLNCGADLSVVDDPSYCWECGWELDA